MAAASSSSRSRTSPRFSGVASDGMGDFALLTAGGADEGDGGAPVGEGGKDAANGEGFIIGMSKDGGDAGSSEIDHAELPARR